VFDEFGGELADHHARRHCVSACHSREDRRIGDAKAIEPMDAKAAIHD
jgi:hypothetical protein